MYSGPTYRSHKIEDGRAIISFDHVGGGLEAKGKLKGLTIAGEEGEFMLAQVHIEGDRIVVWSDRIFRPQAVRYGWKNNPEEANLYNAEGLPASPFRTAKE